MRKKWCERMRLAPCSSRPAWRRRADYHCPHVRERVGRVGDGGKWLCGVASLLQRPGCVAFALGSDGDTSFEEALLNRTRCEVHTFDHTLNATEQAAVRRVAGVRLHDTGLAAEPAAAGATLQTLPAMMAGLQVAWLDVLKVDVEGAEWRALAHW